MHIGLCEGRHEIKTNEGEALASAFFSKIPSLHLYVTGLTTLLTATLLAAEKAGVESLILMHFDRETGKYIPQDVSPLL